MSDDIIDVQLVEEKLVTCPNCGRRNRVHKHDHQVGFRCGVCGAELSNPFAVARLSPKSLFAALRSLSLSKPRKALLPFAILGVVVTGFCLAILHVYGTRPGPLQRTPQEVQEILAYQRARLLETMNVSRSAAQPLPRFQPPRTLANGTPLMEPLLVGDGMLIIENGTPHDAVIKVVDEGAGIAVVAFYVRAGNTWTAKHLPVGAFRVIFACGTDWDSATRTFTRDKSYMKFDRLLDFVTSKRTEGDVVHIQYSEFTLTLQAVVNGNATTSDVREEEFLKY